MGPLPSLIAALTAPEPGSRWSARSVARKNDLDAGEERSRMARGGKPSHHRLLQSRHHKALRNDLHISLLVTGGVAVEVLSAA